MLAVLALVPGSVVAGNDAVVGEEEAARRRGAIMAEHWGYQLAEQRKRLGFTQVGLAEIMGVTPGRVSQIEHGEVSTVEALASYIASMLNYILRQYCQRRTRGI